ncbi:MAG: cysteine--tRNA ligase [Candidatus Methylomirabilis oxygeniifera]|uniref:Cysteine--tRNA ligase n=1 Tax=Methylomirabilis oxygeniifera TaxID=671143 RepID=D5MK15_METO1|nr:MAG: cysteine--tRNA ligase [Candidatus Methylomirabilis oxyfera]CBE67598.1 Cysteinyl-tRNA synthetase (Cysteine--tRNA ligase) (CysRS) [Candidatus Methylomirabilis oxyfera]
MALVVYNTLHQKKERFEPAVPGEVRMYACGPTVYDRAHIGHARAALTFDVVWRYLERRGYKVSYVRNYTDVDDKIIQRAAELGQSRESLVEEQIEAYRRDMDALGLRTPTEEPRATRHIREMIEIIRTLMAKGVAYSVDGDVYFEVRRSSDYGKLSHRGLDELQAGARVEVDPRKRDPLDFALWKASRPGEPAWESPWGPGRPGWHIECSAMSMKYLGETFDIHGGGADLIFPHHENEIAQSECATGKPFARYWIHNGFVNIRAEKMSKSLGNILTIRELLGRISPCAFKLFLLGTHYRAPVEFSEDALISATAAAARFHTVLEEVQRFQDVQGSKADRSRMDSLPLSGQIREAEQEYTDAMDDDFNTPRALAALFNLTKGVNVALRDVDGAPEPSLVYGLSMAGETLRTLGSVLGGLFEGPREVVDRLIMTPSAGTSTSGTAASVLRITGDDYCKAREAVESAMASGHTPPTEAIRTIVAYRALCRDRKDWTTADAIRTWLTNLGVVVDDTGDGVRWYVAVARAKTHRP